MRRGASALAHMLQNFPLLQNRTRQFPARSPAAEPLCHVCVSSRGPEFRKGWREGAMPKLTARIAVIVLATALSSAAMGRGGGHGGGGHGGGHGGSQFPGGGHGFHAAHFGGAHHFGGRSAFFPSASS